MIGFLQGKEKDEKSNAECRLLLPGEAKRRDLIGKKLGEENMSFVRGKERRKKKKNKETIVMFG